MNLILSGMPASGKTFFGKAAATFLQKEFIDTDEQIVIRYAERFKKKYSCREIVLGEGEPFFRNLEKEVINDLQGKKDSIIALGGGAWVDQENIALLKNLGFVLFLKVDPTILLERLLSKKDIPSYLKEKDPQESFKELLKKRIPLFEAHAHQIVDVEKENVLEVIKGFYAK